MTKRRRRKKGSGQLLLRKKGYVGRVRVTIDGVEVQRSYPLGTHDRGVASRKLADLVRTLEAGGDPDASAEKAKRPETVEEAARRIVAQQKADGMRTWKDRLHRLESYLFPELGEKDPAKVRVGEIKLVLKNAKTDGKSKQSLVHLRNDMGVVFGELWRDELIPENPVKKVKIPKGAKVDKRERAVLTDDELARYLAWVHPIEQHRMPVLERQTMAAVCRLFGGLRTRELHALRWEGFDAAEGRFTKGYIRRAKDEDAQELEIPAMLRPILRDWWERHGRPLAGPLFPVRRGKRAGEERAKHSHAHAFRRDLERAQVAPHAPECTEDGCAPHCRLHELLNGNDRRKPVDFHSWRRAYKQALAEANVDYQQSMALSGVTDLGAHVRYLKNTSKMRRLPDAALPRLDITATTPLPRALCTEHAQSEATDDDDDELSSMIHAKRGVPQPGRGPALGEGVEGQTSTNHAESSPRDVHNVPRFSGMFGGACTMFVHNATPAQRAFRGQAWLTLRRAAATPHVAH